VEAALTLCFVKDRRTDRLYRVEEADIAQGVDGELIHPLQGRRIVVLSLQGHILQVYTHPIEGQTFSDVFCCFDGKLLAPVVDGGEFVGHPVKPAPGPFL
jgi:hypothetical protein